MTKKQEVAAFRLAADAYRRYGTAGLRLLDNSVLYHAVLFAHGRLAHRDREKAEAFLAELDAGFFTALMAWWWSAARTRGAVT